MQNIGFSLLNHGTYHKLHPPPTTTLLGFSSCFPLCLLADQRVKAWGPESTGQLLWPVLGTAEHLPSNGTSPPKPSAASALHSEITKNICAAATKGFYAYVSAASLMLFGTVQTLCLSCRWTSPYFLLEVVWYREVPKVAPSWGAAHVCMWKPASLCRAGTSGYTDTPSHQVKMFLAGKCFLFPWNPPYP